MSDIARLLEECGCDCVEHRDLEDHDCLAGKAEFEWVEMKKEIERLRARIEELKEQSSYWENLAFNLALGREETSDFLSGHHIITTDQIREAWRDAIFATRPDEEQTEFLEARQLGIVRCECGDGFVIGGEDE